MSSAAAAAGHRDAADAWRRSSSRCRRCGREHPDHTADRPQRAPSRPRCRGGRSRHERDRNRARGHGPSHHRQRHQVLAVARAPGRSRSRGRDRPPAGEPRRSRRADLLDRGVGEQRRDQTGPPSRDPGVVTRRAVGGDRGAAQDDRGGGHSRQDHDVVDARPGARRSRPAPELHHRRRGERDRDERGLGLRRAARRRGRRERRDLPAPARRSSGS